ncbi:SOS-induced cell division inhibitor SulA [Pantoea sp. 1.19]|uniref:SOS-induced cell division inhibitor SulA n=1 Tax=Pantoea sp. 1.19 TaxID=1925589 RepID=UPI000948D219|nr:SOS-induced cell division inhibitor SulA [Pantoea sp. 1.19]
MHTHHSHRQPAPTTPAAPSCKPATSLTGRGLVSEVIYHPQRPGISQMLLLPLLQQLAHQSRWQLWLTPPHKLRREWFEQAGLNVGKVMQLPQESAAGINSIDAMIKALKTGNFSVVLCWIDGDISPQARQDLDDAAATGGSLGLIMRPHPGDAEHDRPLNAAIIQSVLYH